MNDSLAICQEQFKEYWGQTLVNTLRALHDVKYRSLKKTNRKKMIAMMMIATVMDITITTKDLNYGY